MSHQQSLLESRSELEAIEHSFLERWKSVSADKMAILLHSMSSELVRFWERTTSKIAELYGESNIKLSLWIQAKPINICSYGKIKEIIKEMDNILTQIGDETSFQSSNSKPPLLFISHSSKDIVFVKQLVDLLVFLKFDSKTLFCSSMPGYDIPVGEDIYDFLRNRFLNFKIFVIFVHSTNFYESHPSLNEMGAAWALKSKHISILLPGFKLESMDGVVNDSKVAIVIDKADVWNRLNSMKEQLLLFFNLPEPNQSAWENKRNLFIDEIRK